MSHHFHPESWATVREGGGQALTGARAGRAIEHRKRLPSGMPRSSLETEGSIRPTDMARGAGIPRCRRTQARTYALHRDLGGLHAIPLSWAGSLRKGGIRNQR